jgi:hypothetical protein
VIAGFGTFGYGRAQKQGECLQYVPAGFVFGECNDRQRARIGRQRESKMHLRFTGRIERGPGAPLPHDMVMRQLFPEFSPALTSLTRPF